MCGVSFQSRDADVAESLPLSSSSCSFTMRSSSSSVSSTFNEGLVHQLRTSNCSKFTALVNMHLSFLLDLSFLSELIEDRMPSSSAAENPDKAQAIVSVFSKKKQGKGELLTISKVNEMLVLIIEIYCSSSKRLLCFLIYSI